MLNSALDSYLKNEAVDLAHGTKDVLAHVLDFGYWRRFRSADVVGTGRNHSNLFPKLVGGLSQRLVLAGVSEELNG